MTVAKITISIPEELLGEVDAEAAATGETRSFVIREATASYIARKHADAAAEEHRRSVEKALASMQRIAELPSDEPRSSLELLRELRSRDGIGSTEVDR